MTSLRSPAEYVATAIHVHLHAGVSVRPSILALGAFVLAHRAPTK